MWLGRGDLFGFVAELLLPPLGLAALDLGLRVRHVGGELALLVRQPFLELGERFLALLELVAADLDVGLELGFAQLELAFALVELLQLLVQVLLEAREPGLALVGALFVRLGDRLEVRRVGLAGDELALPLLEADVPLLEVAAAVGVPLGVRDPPLAAGPPRPGGRPGRPPAGRARRRGRPPPGRPCPCRRARARTAR